MLIALQMDARGLNLEIYFWFGEISGLGLGKQLFHDFDENLEKVKLEQICQIVRLRTRGLKEFP